ncbi:MAG: hypothetical protein HC841_00065 [Verrucomicrobiae bacterium]|nr:hypothetical protein [Verrucomicrobiae bacterium]
MRRNTDYFSIDTHEVGQPTEEYVRFDAVCLSLRCAGRRYEVDKIVVFCPHCEDALVWMPIRKDGLPKRFYAEFGARKTNKKKGRCKP